MNIRPISETDFDQVWPIIRDVVQGQETYAYDPAMDRETAWPGRFTIHGRVIGVGFLALDHIADDGPDLIEIGFADGADIHEASCGWITP